MFALVDCNNFFSSCERVFQPHYCGLGVAVLSSNDSCIIARSDEVKELGVPMGAPYSPYRALLHRHHVAVFSGNFPLYGDMSMRIQQVIRRFYADVEVYSVDEWFIKLPPNLCETHMAEMQRLRRTVMQWTGIPVSIGLGSSKTLAKLASNVAKKHKSGVVDATEPETLRHLMALDTSEVWGIGRRWQKKLAQRGVYTVAQFCQQPQGLLRQYFGLVGIKIREELRGVPCHDIAEWQPKKSLLSSRSFAEPQSAFSVMNAALAQHVSRVAEKARAQQSLARALQVFVCRAERGTRRGGRTLLSQTTALRVSSSDPKDLMPVATSLLRSLYRPGHTYRKAGVMLFDLVPVASLQGGLFHDACCPQRQRLLQSMDRINRTMGARTLRFASEETRQKKLYNCANVSKQFTTRWKDIPRAVCR